MPHICCTLKVSHNKDIETLEEIPIPREVKPVERTAANKIIWEDRRRYLHRFLSLLNPNSLTKQYYCQVNITAAESQT